MKTACLYNNVFATSLWKDINSILNINVRFIYAKYRTSSFSVNHTLLTHPLKDTDTNSSLMSKSLTNYNVLVTSHLDLDRFPIVTLPVVLYYFFYKASSMQPVYTHIKVLVPSTKSISQTSNLEVKWKCQICDICLLNLTSC